MSAKLERSASKNVDIDVNNSTQSVDGVGSSGGGSKPSGSESKRTGTSNSPKKDKDADVSPFPSRAGFALNTGLGLTARHAAPQVKSRLNGQELIVQLHDAVPPHRIAVPHPPGP